ncbi:NAD(P)/FAD-dependent oxidoreductase [archaeon]|jgi:thioredoxin reductase (NADPH)|nr:NAD(P)/FAD-dependent oxidoreductase [archaeon]MBT3578107.1 NAD(P)/FAD-dependent oxidoreductase [archaeon]MBT6820655.1 NAD(P)/FAD-dependent oxidoreductase [archaeon]MBT6955700.1 NAD(P)/FAD-dependent oxidoreductase [archaeon]MBT7024935.1 NAD(P)/FAD-dependent oxidoreductase [archaeon]
MKRIYDTIVIGAGPAGTSAACYAKRYGLDTLLISPNIGGQVNFTKKIFSNTAAGHGISSSVLVKRYEDSLNKENVNIVSQKVIDISKENEYYVIKTDDDQIFYSKTIILAIGRGPKKISLPFDESVKDKTVNYFTDFPFRKFEDKKKILLVGGGYCGLDTAEELKDVCEEIIMIERTNKLGGNSRRQEEIKNCKNVKILMNTNLEKIHEINDQKFARLNVGGEIKEMGIDGIFVAVGTSPATNFLNKFEKNNQNELVISLSKEKGKMYMTSQEGIFACGDCNDMPAKGFEPLSVGEGIQCAKTVCNYLESATIKPGKLEE